MKRLFGCLTLFAAGLGAPPFDPFQGFGPPQFFEAFQSATTPQIFEYKSGSLIGGTYLGVSLAEINADRARELKLKEAYGVEISRVEESSPAEKAGLKTGDVVLEYNGQRVEGMEQFGRLVRDTPAAPQAKLLISPNGANPTPPPTPHTPPPQPFPPHPPPPPPPPPPPHS